MTRNDFCEKLRLCASPSVDVDALIDALSDLPNATDLTRITRHLPQLSP